MKKTFFAILILFLSIASFAQKISPDNIIGIWECEAYKIEIFKAGDTYSAKLLWAKDIFEADGKTPKKDDQNPDEKLRTRPQLGLIHITGLTFKNGEYVDGKLYSVQDGNTYSLKAALNNINNLEIRGYKDISMMEKTFIWTRVQ